MKVWWQTMVMAILAFFVGYSAWGRLDGGHNPLVSARARQESWSMPVPAEIGIAKANQQWAAHLPFGAPPLPEPPPPPPPPIPVGIVKVASGYEAIFVVAGHPIELRLRPGGRLPDGGRVIQIREMEVAWVDGQGRRQRREMLAGPFTPTAVVH